MRGRDPGLGPSGLRRLLALRGGAEKGRAGQAVRQGREGALFVQQGHPQRALLVGPEQVDPLGQRRPVAGLGQLRRQLGARKVPLQVRSRVLRW